MSEYLLDLCVASEAPGNILKIGEDSCGEWVSSGSGENFEFFLETNKQVNSIDLHLCPPPTYGTTLKIGELPGCVESGDLDSLDVLSGEIFHWSDLTVTQEQMEYDLSLCAATTFGPSLRFDVDLGFECRKVALNIPGLAETDFFCTPDSQKPPLHLTPYVCGGGASLDFWSFNGQGCSQDVTTSDRRGYDLNLCENEVTLSEYDYSFIGEVTVDLKNSYEYPCDVLLATCYSGESLELTLLKDVSIENLSSFSGEFSHALDFVTYRNFSPTSHAGQIAAISLTTYPSIEMQVGDAGTGHYLEFDLSTQPSIESSAYSGTQFECGLTVHPLVKIPLDVFHGSLLNVTLKTVDLFNFDFRNGEVVDQFNLTVAPYIDLGSIAIESGCLLDVEVVTSAIIDATLHSGEVLETALDTVEAETLVFDMPDGCALFTSVQASVLFDLSATGGHELRLETLSYSPSIDLYYRDGQFSDFQLTRFAPIELANVTAYSGEWSSYSLVTSSIFDISAYDGQRLNVDVTPFPAEYFSFDIQGGNSSEVSLSVAFAIRPRAYAGSLFEVNLATSPSTDIQITPASGEVADINIKFERVSFLDLDCHAGEYAFVGSLVESDSYDFLAGCSSEFRVATEYNVPLDFNSGSTSGLDVGLHPSWPLGVFTCANGESSDGALHTFIHPLLKICFRNEQKFQLFIDSAVDFDLQTDECCKRKPDLGSCVTFVTDLSREPIPSVRYDGKDFLDIDINIRLHQNIQLQFHEGTGWDTLLVGKGEVLSDLRPIGVGSFSDMDFSYDRNLKICTGNFIPVGDNANAELVDVYNDSCESFASHTGAYLGIECLSVSTSLYPDVLAGEAITFQLQTWRGQWYSYTGEWCHFNLSTDTQLPLDAVAGEVFISALYDPPFIFYCGQMLKVAGEMVFDLHVEITESGEIDNEYRYLNWDGSQAMETIEAAIETYPYRYEIKYRC